MRPGNPFGCQSPNFLPVAGGGGGGYSALTYSVGQLSVGSNVGIVVGAGGAGGFYSGYTLNDGGNGAPGEVYISWNSIPPPTCAVTFNQNPIPYGSSTTLHWSVGNGTHIYITNVGWIVGTSGSFGVTPPSTTDYSCYGYNVSTNGYSALTPAVLTVTPPPLPTAIITTDQSSITVGQSTGIHATYTAGSGDAITADNIDSPVGTGLGNTTAPDPRKDITFTPATAGTYTFYARMQTSYYRAWATYKSTIVTVTASPVPACTLSVVPTAITTAQSATLSWNSSNATSFTINNGIGSVTPNTPNSQTVNPAVTTTYTGTVVNGAQSAS